ncbi:MAG: hypothetical protein DMF67_02480 [Acidobacteria bacterium]|nr:MAG: hypothetical protein DMF66_04230 [Acidobacteriota bacterium]PYS85015.1 MAG: hypothetical protein DMF67_02480 [Acidobacteriota bacterium]
MSSERVNIYTVGHGRHAWADFLALLRQYRIELVCDVRSAARSRWPQFNGRVLAENLRESGIGYEWLPECGGKTPAPAEDLSRGLDRIMELAAEARVALMCSESQPLTKHSKPRANCHRVGLLGPPLRALGARLVHILPGGGALEVDESSLPSVW